MKSRNSGLLNVLTAKGFCSVYYECKRNKLTNGQQKGKRTFNPAFRKTLRWNFVKNYSIEDLHVMHKMHYMNSFKMFRSKGQEN